MMARLAFLIVILAQCVAGLIASLFGPSAGRLLGLVAFLLHCAVFLVSAKQEEQAHSFNAGGISGRYPAVRRLGPTLRAAILGCQVSWATSAIVMFPSAWRWGVTDGTSQVFAERTVYKLIADGVRTEVTRIQYLIAASSFTVGWHSFGMLMALTSMHVILFGDWPPGCGPAGGLKPGRSSGSETARSLY